MGQTTRLAAKKMLKTFFSEGTARRLRGTTWIDTGPAASEPLVFTEDENTAVLKEDPAGASIVLP